MVRYLMILTNLWFACTSSTQRDGIPQFSIEWYTSDTTVSIDYLRKNVVDVGITYHAVAEHTALEEHIVDRVEYVWRDHWMLVGTRLLTTLAVDPFRKINIFSQYFPPNANPGTGSYL